MMRTVFNALARIISALTFPGVIVHEIAHQFFCRRARLAVFDVCYFRFGVPAGYVAHEPPRTVYQHMLAEVGPFFVNTFVGAVIALPAAIPIFTFRHATLAAYLLLWLGIAIAMHAFPSLDDAKSMWRAVTKEGSPALARAVAVPVAGLMYLGAAGSFVLLDLAYGVAVAIVIPNVIVSALA